VTDANGLIEFSLANDGRRARLLFLPGGVVDPNAYAPLLRAVAEAGHPVTLVRLPFLGRHAPGEGARRETVARAVAIIEADTSALWIVAGHSLGGHLAARVARRAPRGMRGLVLLGTTHPRDFSLAESGIPITKVYGTNDGIAPLHRMRENAPMLPESTTWVPIEGGNHSQFGYYGFQVGDHRATISREQQQRQVLDILLGALDSLDARAPLDGHTPRT
jgi:pimeloyl-ACP methyl ester carboxylesterase